MASIDDVRNAGEQASSKSAAAEATEYGRAAGRRRFEVRAASVAVDQRFVFIEGDVEITYVLDAPWRSRASIFSVGLILLFSS